MKSENTFNEFKKAHVIELSVQMICACVVINLIFVPV